MSLRRWVLALCAFFVAGVGVAACGSNVPGNSVADVAGNPITMRAFNHWMYVAAKAQTQSTPGLPVIVPTDPPQFNGCISQLRKQSPALAKVPADKLRAACKRDFSSLSLQVLDSLIQAYWEQALAAKDRMNVTKAELQKTLNHDKQQQFGGSETQFRNFLTQSGMTVQDVLFQVRIGLINSKLLHKAVKPVSQSEIAAYYASHKSDFGTPESRDFRVILAKTSSSASASLSALKKHQSWTTVAKRYSIDPATKDKGGLLTGITRGQEDQALEKAAFSAPVGKLVGPIKSPFGYYVVQVTKINPAKQESLAQARTVISQTLNLQSQSRARNLVAMRARKAYLSQTFCRSSFLMIWQSSRVPKNQVNCSGYRAPTK
jgi:foldase protein PrsA